MRVPFRHVTLRRAMDLTKVASTREYVVQRERMYRAHEMVKMDKFDELPGHLRDIHPKLIGTCSRDDKDVSFLTACVRKGVAALEVIDLLVEKGVTKREVMICAASNCRVDLLETVCERGWHVDILDVYLDMIVAIGEHGTICNRGDPHSSASVALAFADWLYEEAISTWFSDCFDFDIGEWIDGGNEVTDERWILCSEYALVNEAFEFCEGLFGRGRVGMVYLSAVRFAARKGAMRTLDYLCEANHRIGEYLWWTYEGGNQIMFSEIRRELDDDYWEHPMGSSTPASWIKWDERNRLKVELWLLKRCASPARDHMKRAMERLDTVKERIPEGDYLVIANEMGKAYKGI